ncbi:hypothetical protein [Lentilactobacillus hilgardii]|uniref:hypothetical protein n=1 Tax=Lentilactobacillus hilgardii TaxID=1588 RepID=UPI003FA5FE98
MKDDHIIYPELVEQSHAYLLSRSVDVSKDVVYRNMIKCHLIDQNGQPTRKAIDEGLVSEANDPNSLALFKARNPLFLPYDDRHFTLVAKLQEWAADLYVAKDVSKRIIDGRAIGDKQHAQAVLKYLEKQEGDHYQ